MSNTCTVDCMIACIHLEAPTCIWASCIYSTSKLQNSLRLNSKTFIHTANGRFGPMSSSITAFPDFLVKLCISGCHSLNTCKEQSFEVTEYVSAADANDQCSDSHVQAAHAADTNRRYPGSCEA